MSINIMFNKLSKTAKTQIYIDNMVPILNRRAFFSDGTERYRTPAEPMPGDLVTVRFRTARENVDNVYLMTAGNKQLMMKESSDKLFDYYVSSICVEDKEVDYYFMIASGRRICYYNMKGISSEFQEEYNFVIMPGFKTPDWAKGAVFYQIYVDRFFNGDTSNDVQTDEYSYINEKVVKVSDWNKYPATMGVREFYGGDLMGVIKKLDYLEELGIEVIYFNPIFVSPSNHKYDIQDYDYIDPHFGLIVKEEGELLPEGDMNNEHATKYICRVTNKDNLEASNQLFIELVEEAHKRGIKIVLDGVFNHCGSFNKWLDREKIYEEQEGYEKGAYVAEDSPYHSFFGFRGGEWPYNDKYDGWWGHDTLPKLNFEDSPKLFEYIMEVARKWVSPPFNIDGWRLDVAADLGHSEEYNHSFWREFRRVVKEANPNAIIIAEHYGDPSPWLKGDQWDTVMNYDAFMEPLSWFLTGVEKHSDEFRGDLLGKSESFFGAMEYHMTRFNTQSLQVAMNELSNHDHSRFLTRTNHMVGRTANLGAEAAAQHINKAILRVAVVIQMTWQGAPTVYYGDEAGVCGWTDPDNRRTYPWGHEDHELIAFHKEIIGIHKDYTALKTGSIKFLSGGTGFISYGRFDETDRFIVAVNNNNKEITIDINVWEIGMLDDELMVRLMYTDENSYNMEAVRYTVDMGAIQLTLPPVSAFIIKNMPKL